MADFAPPAGPPPPKLPEGWKAVWNDQYSEWFFVNIYTKKSQWDKPTEPVYPAGEAPLDHPPPSYAPGAGGPVGTHTTGTSEKSSFSSNNPYANVNVTDDEKYARQLQQEEEARARSHGPGAPGAGASHDYYGQPGQPQPNQYGGSYPQQSGTPYGQSQTPMHDTQPQERSSKKGGLLGKLISKAQGHGSSSGSHGYPPQQQHGYGQHGYGAPMGAPMGGGYYQQPGRPMMGGPMGGGMMGGGRRPGGGGMGASGAMALGAGGGLLGGALLGSAMADGGDGGDTYINNDYGDDGGDMGGGDMGGDMGDMGGDF